MSFLSIRRLLLLGLLAAFLGCDSNPEAPDAGAAAATATGDGTIKAPPKGNARQASAAD